MTETALRNNGFIGFLTILLLALTLVDTYAGNERGRDWDLALNVNICHMQTGDIQNLIGVELVNPLTNLGIEDIETWDWMRQDYLSWIQEIDSAEQCN